MLLDQGEEIQNHCEYLMNGRACGTRQNNSPSTGIHEEESNCNEARNEIRKLERRILCKASKQELKHPWFISKFGA